MTKKSVYKIPGGKMIRTELEYENQIIKNIKITGDFFIHPEEGISLIEGNLKGVKTDNIIGKIEETIKNNKLVLFGLTPKAVAKAIKLAMENG